MHTSAVVEAIPDSTIEITDCPTDIAFFGLSNKDVASSTLGNKTKTKGQHVFILQVSGSSTLSTLHDLARKLWRLLSKAMQNGKGENEKREERLRDKHDGDQLKRTMRTA
eukprot:399650-Amorphochlora_amoeboformis.AAC.1